MGNIFGKPKCFLSFKHHKIKLIHDKNTESLKSKSVGIDDVLVLINLINNTNSFQHCSLNLNNRKKYIDRIEITSPIHLEKSIGSKFVCRPGTPTKIMTGQALINTPRNITKRYLFEQFMNDPQAFSEEEFGFNLTVYAKENGDSN